MQLSRRNFLTTAAALGSTTGTAFGGRGLRGLRIGVTDWNLNQTAKLESIALAKSLGFEGVQVSLGRKPENDKLPLDNAELQAQFVAESKKHGLPINGTCLDVLHTNYLKNDKLGQKWVADSISITKALNTKVILLPFFGKGALTTKEEMDYVGDLLREIAPQAEKAGVIFGLEDTISAEDNVRIMDRSRSKAVLVYYDIGNSTHNGFDVKREIDWLGAKRICQFHFKDNPNYLGEGKIDMKAVLETISRLGYQGYANLETDSPSKSVENDMRRNLAYVRKVIGEVRQS
jgi:L-ribulose-5-phosphate 3-epimerase